MFTHTPISVSNLHKCVLWQKKSGWVVEYRNSYFFYKRVTFQFLSKCLIELNLVYNSTIFYFKLYHNRFPLNSFNITPLLNQVSTIHSNRKLIETFSSSKLVLCIIFLIWNEVSTALVWKHILWGVWKTLLIAYLSYKICKISVPLQM